MMRVRVGLKTSAWRGLAIWVVSLTGEASPLIENTMKGTGMGGIQIKIASPVANVVALVLELGLGQLSVVS